MTCRCTCQAYGGHCDCWFDGSRKGEAETVAAIVAWLRTFDDREINDLGLNAIGTVADLLESGDWRPKP